MIKNLQLLRYFRYIYSLDSLDMLITGYRNSGPKSQRTANFTVGSIFPISFRNNLDHSFVLQSVFLLLVKLLVSI